MIILNKRAAFMQHLRAVAFASVCLIGLSDCAEQADDAENAQHSSASLRNNAEDAGEEEDAGSGSIAAYQPCDQSVDECGGNNALCASYVADPGTQFCAPFCQFDALCPDVPGFSAGCNLAWCALLCNDGRCPVGMACVRDVPFLDFQGNDRGTREVCVIAPRDSSTE